MNIQKLKILLTHAWLDTRDAQRAVPVAVLQRLGTYIATSEKHHTGQIRICVEAALPLSYVWRMNRANTPARLIRQRALMLFSKLRVWDTEHNNGVLIYLQLAERTIEIVADRGVSRHVTSLQWQTMMERMRASFQQRQFEDGLVQAIEQVSALLVAHFPAALGVQPVNELPDVPQVQ